MTHLSQKHKELQVVELLAQGHNSTLGEWVYSTVPKYNEYFVGDPEFGNVYSYINNDLVSDINIGAGYGQSVWVDDEGIKVAVGFTSNTDPSHITTFENTIKVLDYTDDKNPFVYKTLTAADPTAQLRYTRISGDGTHVVALDIVNSVLYVFNIEADTQTSINVIENNAKFDISSDGSRIVVGIFGLSQYRVYIRESGQYNIEYNKPVDNTLGMQFM